MVYINSDGSIGVKPWYKNIGGMFWGFFHFIIAFFQTLIYPIWGSSGNRSINNRSSGNGGGGGGGGGGKPTWRQRPFGAQCRTISSLQSPMPSGG